MGFIFLFHLFIVYTLNNFAKEKNFFLREHSVSVLKVKSIKIYACFILDSIRLSLSAYRLWMVDGNVRDDCNISYS